MMKRKLLFGFVALMLVLVWLGIATAGTVGKINGVIKDQKGAPLPGANLIIEGAKQGAVTDANGYYLILNVSPGTYRLTASLIGYDKVTKSSVGVIVDQTTTVDFALKETAVQMSEVTVVAERPLVEPDKTTSKYTVSREQTERLLSAARNTQEILQLQPGVAVDGSNRIRGSFIDYNWDGSDVAYVVDGVRMNYNDGRGLGGRSRTVNRGSVQELSVLTGVMPAEYGNAQGAVVQVVTKDGENRYHGWGEFRFEPPGKKHWGANVYDAPEHRDKIHWADNKWLNERRPPLDVADPRLKAMAGELVHARTDYTKEQGWDAEGNLSGPIGNNASFVATVRHSRLANPLPGPEKTGFRNDTGAFIASGPNNISGSGSLTFRPTQNVKVKAGALFQGWKMWNDGNPDPTGKPRIGDVPGLVRGPGQNLFLPEKWSGAGQLLFREELEYAVLTHTISPKTYYEVRVSRSRSKMDTARVFDVASANNQDKAGWFNIGRTAIRWGLYDRQRYGIKVDVSSQVSKGHFVKAGLEFQPNSIWMLYRIDGSAADRGMLVLGNKGRIKAPVHPYFVNAYIQDKMEFQGMIVNLGLRMDAFNGNTRTFTHGAFRGAPMFRTFTRQQGWAYQDGSVWTTPFSWKVAWSPRIGISHPITQRSQVRFSSGVFLQWPDLWYYFGEDYYSAATAKDLDINGDGRIDPSTELYNTMRTTYSGFNGNQLLRTAKTTAFEVGTDWNFVSDYTATLTAYYKSEVDQFNNLPNEGWDGPTDLAINYSRTLDNGSYGDTRGVELSVKKAFSHYFSFQVSYNYQWASATRGKLGSWVRNIVMDSITVAKMAKTTAYTDPTTGVQVPQFWVEFEKGKDGREIPKQMTEADIKKYGHQAQDIINSRRTDWYNGSPSIGNGIWDGVRKAEGPAGDLGVGLVTGGYASYFVDPKPGDRRNFGSMALLLSLPDDFKFGPVFLGNLLSNLRMTMITKIETGGIFSYRPPEGGEPTYRSLEMDSHTDLAMEKTFNPKGRVQPTLFVDIRNMFNQQDRTSPTNSTDYTYYGIDKPRPDDPNFVSFGDARDRVYAVTPRLVQIGLRMNW